jgi:hypothetical protein
MLISHRYKFVFLKTEKAASSSLHTVLRRIIAEHDTIHRADRSVKDRLLREHGSIANFSFSSGGGRRRRWFPQAVGLYRHAFARDVRAFLGPDLFDSYTVITSERNPWDRQVSLFTHRASKHPERALIDFGRAMRSPSYNFFHHNRLHNWEIYTLNGRVCADYVIRFENLDEDFRAVLIALGIDADRYALPHKRARPRGQGPSYRDYYTDDTKELIGRWYRREIQHFGYTF